MKPQTPLLAADVIIELTDRFRPCILLIERKNPPYGWAIPGGFVDIGETVEHAAIREMAEETGLAVQLSSLLGGYSDPRRDPRGHTVTVVYVGQAKGQPKAADDARAVRLVDPYHPPGPLAFDHAGVLADYRRFLETGQKAPLRPEGWEKWPL